MSYLDRYRPASYIAPDGDEFPFKVNSLKKSGGKKSSTQEIIDSNQSETQDQGNKTYSYPVNAYFTGPDYDLDLDAFVKALEQKHTIDNPGTLIHPRYGDISVFPTTWEISEELVSGNTVGRIDITFVEVFTSTLPISTTNELDTAYGNITALQALSLEIGESLNLDKVSSQTNLVLKINNVVGIIDNAISELTEIYEEIQNEFDTIVNEISTLVEDIENNITEIIAAVQELINLPSQIVSEVTDRINVFETMIQNIATNILDVNETLLQDLKNNSILLQIFAGFAVACISQSASFTEFQLRPDVTNVIDIINDSFDYYNDIFEQSRVDGKVSQEYSGDHNFYSLLLDTITRINTVLLNSAFDLKAEKKFTLKNDSDIITETYKAYGSVSTENIDFFINTNKILENEFLELSAGREVVIYV